MVATITEMSGMSMPARPIERRKGSGSTISASRPMATVVPLSTTARPAVPMAAMIAASPSAPESRSSRQRTTTRSE